MTDRNDIVNKGYVDDTVKALKDKLSGGSAGHVLSKNSANDYGFNWKILSVHVFTRGGSNNLK